MKGALRVGKELIDLLLPGACLGCGSRIACDDSNTLFCVCCLTGLRAPPPPLCARCGIPLGSKPPRSDTCAECSRWPEVLRAARSAVLLESPADRLVHGLKYGGWKALAGTMGRRMARVPLPPFEGSTIPLIVPVPTTRTRRRRRGYNQAAVLARVVGVSLGFPLLPALVRRAGGRTQVSLQPAERARNVRRAFSVGDGFAGGVEDRDVLLVDDVLTTGATAGAASLVLEEAGVRSVTLLTFARALPYGDSGRPMR